MSDELGTRLNEGKLEWSLIDFVSLEGVVKVLMFGKEKYGAFNWKKGLKTTEICESLMRHMFAYLNGEDLDPETGLRHIDHIGCNFIFLSHMDSNRPDCDTRFIDKVKASMNDVDVIIENVINDLPDKWTQENYNKVANSIRKALNG